MVFDSKFTIYKNLKRLDDKEILFITIQRRGKNIVDKLNSLPKSDWKKIRVDCANGKKRTLKIYEEMLSSEDEKIRFLADYGKAWVYYVSGEYLKAREVFNSIIKENIETKYLVNIKLALANIAFIKAEYKKCCEKQ